MSALSASIAVTATAAFVLGVLFTLAYGAVFGYGAIFGRRTPKPRVDLQDFIKRTLFDILKGISAAQRDPTLGQWIVGMKGGQDIPVKFDVAVTAERGGSGGFQVAVSQASVSLGGERGTTSKDVSATRIQFDVPVRLVAGPDIQAELRRAVPDTTAT
jgi:hypothetical protein